MKVSMGAQKSFVVKAVAFKNNKQNSFLTFLDFINQHDKTSRKLKTQPGTLRTKLQETTHDNTTLQQITKNTKKQQKTTNLTKQGDAQ